MIHRSVPFEFAADALSDAVLLLGPSCNWGVTIMMMIVLFLLGSWRGSSPIHNAATGQGGLQLFYAFV